MSPIRFLFFLLILWVLWLMFRNWQRRQDIHGAAQREKARIEAGKEAGKIVRCKYCEVHLPELEALRDGEMWFCTQAHKQAWLGSPGGKT